MRDSRTDTLSLTHDDVPTVHLIDDAHLTAEHALVLAEQATTPSKLLLSALTTSHALGRSPGTIHLDAKRAVGVIAHDLRRRRDETLAAVRLVDDWVGDGIGQEKLELRLDAATRADFPWQFCFILSGGWRRVHSVVASARAAEADLVLGAIAIWRRAMRAQPRRICSQCSWLPDSRRARSTTPSPGWLSSGSSLPLPILDARTNAFQQRCLTRCWNIGMRTVAARSRE